MIDVEEDEAHFESSLHPETLLCETGSRGGGGVEPRVLLWMAGGVEGFFSVVAGGLKQGCGFTFMF